MEKLKDALRNKTLADLKTIKPSGGSNLIEPTIAEIESILTALKDGKDHKEVSRTIFRTSNKAKLSFSKSQIRKIDKARLRKIAELEPPVIV